MLKILQTRLQQYLNQELPYVQAGFRKGRDQITSIHCIIEKAREFKKKIYYFIDYTKAFDCVETGKFLNRWEYQTALPAS
jgi:predicted phosphoadenosine phosphosulfate sulfurtransferase